VSTNLSPTGIDHKKRREPLRFSLWRLTATCILLMLLLLAGIFGFSMLRAASIVYWLSPSRRPIIVRAYSKVFKHQPVVTNFEIAGRNGRLPIRMFTPQHVYNAPTLVLVHGFAPGGNNEFGLNAIAWSLCQLGLRVVVPNIKSEQMLRMSETAVEDVDDVIRWSALTSGQQVSLFGISYSGGMVITAAAVPEFADYVKMIFCVSGYNSIDRLGRYYLHDDVRDPASQPYGKLAPEGLLAPMALQYLDELVPPNDVEALSEPLRLISHGASPAEVAEAQPLTKEQRDLLDDLLSVKTEEMRTHYHALMERHRAELTAISPMGKFNEVHGSLYVLHGDLDPTIPRGEAEWTRQETLHKTNVKVLITPGIHHALLEVHAPYWEKLRVAYFVSQMLDSALWPSPLPTPKR
jgi:pimeloyl-ACP methyl ester carboxylesterase